MPSPEKWLDGEAFSPTQARSKDISISSWYIYRGDKDQLFDKKDRQFQIEEHVAISYGMLLWRAKLLIPSYLSTRKDADMQFIVIAHDGTDEEALQRRLAVREAHIALGDNMVASGHQLYGVALLNDAGRMIGSVIVCEFSSREELDAWLVREPYVTGDVWKHIEVIPCRVGPSFLKK